MRVRSLTRIWCPGLPFILSIVLSAYCMLSACGLAQEEGDPRLAELESHLRYGEFAKALEIVDRLPPNLADQLRAFVAGSQKASGAYAASNQTIARIESDTVRYRALFQQVSSADETLPGRPRERSEENTHRSNWQFQGQPGGVTEADFQPLINLIKTTINPDSWDDTNGDGTILPYPAGVYVDSQGTLHRLKIDSKRSLQKLASRSDVDSGNRAVDHPSALRKVSLKRLERAAQLLMAQGHPLDSELQTLAGIYEVQYVMFLPQTKDVIVAGPAGPWKLDVDGHAINVGTGKPVLSLDDLVVCLRNAQAKPWGNHGKFGCTITPRKENLIATQQFIVTSKLKGKAWRNQLRDSLGFQDVEVFGIDPATHAGRVLVEADYRMKLVAMGIETSISEIPSYLSRLGIGPDGQLDAMDVVRFWFTMNYDQLLADPDKHVFALHGTGVQVLSENEFIDQHGERVHSGRSDQHTAGFARDFTRHFEKIAAVYPVYRRLKNLFDLAIVSALIHTHELHRQADWNLTYFGNHPDYADHVFQPVTELVPTQVHSVMNYRDLHRRQPSSTVKYTLVAVSGGIAFDAGEVLNQHTNIDDQVGQLAHEMAQLQPSTGNWWWD